MRGSWRRGRRTGMSPRLGRRPGCRRRSGACCGRSSSAVLAWNRSGCRGLVTPSSFEPWHASDAETPSSTSRSSTRPRTSASPTAFLSPRWVAAGRTRCSSPATWASASSSSRSRGSRWVWTSAAGRGPCASTTARRTRSDRRRPAARPGVTDVDGNARIGATRCQCSTARRRTIRPLKTRPRRRLQAVRTGWRDRNPAPVCCRTRSGVFVRSQAQLRPRAGCRRRRPAVPYGCSMSTSRPTSGRVPVSTMHLAKGLEFRGVVVMACDDEVIPLQERIETVGDDADLQEVYDTERHLLYVACTRARDHLLVTARRTGVGVLTTCANDAADALYSAGSVPQRGLP